MVLGQERSPLVRDPMGIGQERSPLVRDPMALGQEPCYGPWREFPAVRAVPGGPSPDDRRFGASSAAVAVPGAGSRTRYRRRSDLPPREPSSRALVQICRRMPISKPQPVQARVFMSTADPSPGGSQPRVAGRPGSGSLAGYSAQSANRYRCRYRCRCRCRCRYRYRYRCRCRYRYRCRCRCRYRCRCRCRYRRYRCHCRYRHRTRYRRC